jgi:hypothetical protein
MSFMKLSGTVGNEGSIRIKQLYFKRWHSTLAWLPFIGLLSRVMNRPMAVLSQVSVRIREKNIINRCSEINVMHFLFSLLRIKGLYMFRTLLADAQEALHKRHLVYCVRICQLAALGLEWKSKLAALCAAAPEDEQIMLETCRGSSLLKTE